MAINSDIKSLKNEYEEVHRQNLKERSILIEDVLANNEGIKEHFSEMPEEERKIGRMGLEHELETRIKALDHDHQGVKETGNLCSSKLRS